VCAVRNWLQGKDAAYGRRGNRTGVMAKKQSTENKIYKRSRAVVILLFLSLILVAVRMVTIFLFDGEKYVRAALSQSEQELQTITAKRGDIMDRNGVVLATSNVTYNLILDPKLILTNPDRYLEPTLNLINECFGLETGPLKDKVNEKSDSHYVVLLKNLPYSNVEEFIAKEEKDADVAGVWLEENYLRNYAYGTLACSTLGFMEVGGGAYGLEYEYDDELTGTDGREYSYVNNENILETQRIEAINGNSLKITIDYNIQTIVERNIEDFLKDTEAKTVSVLVQNPSTGEIIAMADSGNFDCNSPRDLSAHYTEEELKEMSDEETTNALSEIWKNFCITQSFEPGSTAKPFTLAAGLEEDSVRLDDKYTCEGSVEFLEHTVKCHINSGHGTLNTKQAIADSCNVALMGMAEKIGVSDFVKYQKKFGFGQYTGIDLPNEMNCMHLLYNEENMKEIDLATNSFGQNFNVTMIQLSTAFCSLINGGYYYKPYMMKGIYNEIGELVKSNDRILVSRTVSPETSVVIKECLRAVVTEGTGTSAAVDGYVISGKTGTAEKSGREEGVYLVSFIGFAPYDRPEVVCYVVIDEPETGDRGVVSAELFSSIMSEVLPYLNVTPGSMDKDPERAAAGTVENEAGDDEEDAGEIGEAEDNGETGEAENDDTASEVTNEEPEGHDDE
jgi:stage V sporulation protein D (sporulation-specific penicillin-binding protein)